MRANVVVPGVVAVAALASFAVGGYAAWAGMVAEGRVGPALSLAFVAVALVIVLGALLLHLRLVKPIDDLARALRTAAETPLDKPPELPSAHMLAGLADGAARSIDALRAARGQSRAAIEAATRRADEQRSRLEAILLDLSEGVVVCNLQHRILLYNQAAARILPANQPEARGMLGLDRPLFAILTREPVAHAIDEMLHAGPAGGGAAGDSASGPTAGKVGRPFVCATLDQSVLLEARLSLILESSGQPSGYVLTFADVGDQIARLSERETLLREVAVEWRRPLASLRAAAEMLAEDDNTADERRAFQEIVVAAGGELSRRFADVTARYEGLGGGPWPLADVFSLDLARSVVRRLEPDGIHLAAIGPPLWLLADAHALMLAIEHLVRAITAGTGIRELEIELREVGRRAFLDISWNGEPLALAQIGPSLREPLPGSIGRRSVDDIVEHHGGELWSERLADGRACLRVALRVSQRPPQPAEPEPQVPRPEYYDFELLFAPPSALEDVPLRKMNYVVFDTETTGLRPTEGDELISIGAVRIVNGRILTGESFERLIDPGRDIPKVSIDIHGITPDMVAGKPPAELVLPQFRAFAADAVLVAYNAAFDMKFLEMKEAKAGVRFDNAVLDPQLLSIYAQPDVQNHSLGAIAQQLGVEVVGRHTAVGDAITTAAVFVKLIDLLEARGVMTFGDAVKISSRMMEQRKRYLQF